MSETDASASNAARSNAVETASSDSNAASNSDMSSDSDASSSALETDDHDRSAIDRAGGVLERVRTERRPHAAAVVVAVAVGLALSWLHWFGLVVGGTLVALTASTPWRGVAGALGFGVVVLAVFAFSLGGSAGTVLEMTPVIYLVVASAIGLPVLGSLVRGIVY